MDYKKYIIVFFITLFLFVTGFYLSDYFNNKKIDQLKSIQDKISVDILSSETQFSLLSEASCNDLPSSALSQEISSLAEKLDYGERTIGANNPDIIALRRYYSLLEIKDYLLMKKVNERCKVKIPYLIYFYSNQDDCADCGRQWRTITALRDKYPDLRIYTFDYHLDLSAVHTLINLYHVENILPAVVLDEKAYNGFVDLDTMEKSLPELKINLSKTIVDDK
jgi:hypothetical protein